MDTKKERGQMLDLLLRPAFCVKDGIITQVSRGAEGMLLASGMEVAPMLSTGAEEYAAFSGGCLYLDLKLGGRELMASVTRLEDEDVFLLEAEEDVQALNALALAARELREPLSSMTAISENLLSPYLKEDPRSKELLARMSRSLHRMQRVLGNMADAGVHSPAAQLQLRNIPRVFDAIFSRADKLLAYAGAQLHYEGLGEDLIGLFDEDLMERAVLNLLSNALRFLPETGGILAAKLSRRGDMLVLTVQDNGSGIPDAILGNLFQQYLRTPALEDRRRGLGLGLVIVRQAAASHGGTVLVDKGEISGTRVTLTMKVRQPSEATVRSAHVALTGGRDPGLIELADILPVSVYEQEL